MKSSILIVIVLLTSLLFEKLYAQDAELDSLVNNLLFDENDGMFEALSSDKKFHFIYSRLNYESNTYFAGRDIGFDQYNMTSQLAYFHSIGISLAAAAAYYSEMDPKISTVVLMGGYSGRFFKKADYRYRISYSRYFFPQNNLLESSLFNSSIAAGLTFDKKIFGSRFDYSYLIGDDPSSQLSWDLYSNINIYKFNLIDKIRFEPEISFYFGSDKTIISKIGIIPGRVPTYYTSYVEKEGFGWMNTELIMPISIDYKNFDFELAYIINLPRSTITTEKFNATTYFSFSIGYIISL